MLKEFKKFALRGNVVDMAVGFTVGAAFAAIARSLVDDILMPPISLLTGRVSFEDKFWVLQAGSEAPPPYATLEAAEEAGAITLNWGLFFNGILTFVIVAFAVFLVVRLVNRAEEVLEREASPEEEDQPQVPDDRKCPYCLQTVPYRALRCAHCTSHLPKPGTPVARPEAGAGA